MTKMILVNPALIASKMEYSNSGSPWGPKASICLSCPPYLLPIPAARSTSVSVCIGGEVKR